MKRKKDARPVEFLKPVKDMEYHPTAEKLVKLICDATQNPNPLFFRVHVAYYFAVMASMMRTNIKTLDREVLPVNLYAINLATSGAGKGHSTNIMEDSVIDQFRKTFTDTTLPILADRNIPKLSLERAQRKQCDPDEELERTNKEYDAAGALFFSFDSATLAAIKQARHKLLMANAGSANFQMDEFGNHLLGNAEAFSAYLELYDVGKIKQKLLKSTADNSRNEEIEGRTPANMMLFGTPSTLFTGGKVEEEFHTMLRAGYARRCFFGFSIDHSRKNNLTARELLEQRMNTDSKTFVQGLSDQFARLADPANAHRNLSISKDVSVLLTEYELDCQDKASELPDHDEAKKAELGHRYFKVLKLAGAYAFVDGSPEITMDHIFNSIKMAEASGEAFGKLLSQDKPYVKLAKYIAAIKRDVTQPDLMDDLPFYKGSNGQRNDMLQLAIAYGYQNNILIKKSFVDGIEFLRGESLEKTNLNEMVVSYSSDIADNYKNDLAPFEQLHKLTGRKGLHWINHHLTDGHRCEDSAIPGFNMVVIDVDGGVTLSVAKTLLKDYKALFYTTKRSTPTDNRFRIIIPTNYELKLDTHDFKEFMRNLFDWLPFDVDDQTGQRARKWLSNDAHHEYQDGEVLDVLPFIPKTSKNETRKQLLTDQASMDNLERWVINNTGDGNRNNQLLRYAMILLDAGFEFEAIRLKVIGLNEKLPDKLSETEILSTIMVTVTRQLSKRPA